MLKRRARGSGARLAIARTVAWSRGRTAGRPARAGSSKKGGGATPLRVAASVCATKLPCSARLAQAQLGSIGLSLVYEARLQHQMHRRRSHSRPPHCNSIHPHASTTTRCASACARPLAAPCARGRVSERRSVWLRSRQRRAAPELRVQPNRPPQRVVGGAAASSRDRSQATRQRAPAGSSPLIRHGMTGSAPRHTKLQPASVSTHLLPVQRPRAGSQRGSLRAPALATPRKTRGNRRQEVSRSRRCKKRVLPTRIKPGGGGPKGNGIAARAQGEREKAPTGPSQGERRGVRGHLRLQGPAGSTGVRRPDPRARFSWWDVRHVQTLQDPAAVPSAGVLGRLHLAPRIPRVSLRLRPFVSELQSAKHNPTFSLPRRKPFCSRSSLKLR